MFPTFISILDIQSWWEVPSIAHFCSLFRTAFNLLDFDIEDLEEALLTDGTEEGSWLQELIVRLLSGCLPNNEISTFNYQMFLRRLFRQKCQEHDQYNPFNTDVDFQLLPLRTKVDILHALCDFRLDADDVLDQLKNLEPDSLRVEPLGYDSNDSAYWYFYGTRLYREDFKTKNNKRKSVWQVICFTEDDWFQLNKKFKKSSIKCERELYRTLSENFLPELPRLFREKERLARKRLLENQPRRFSRRLRKDNLSEKVEDLSKLTECEKDLTEEEVNRPESEIQSEDSASEKSEGRYEMGGAKPRQKKSKGRQRKLSDSSSSSKDAAAASSSSKRKKSQDSDKAKSATGTTTVGRQTNNSLAAATGQIVIQPVSNSHKKKLKTSQVFRQTDEDLITGMHKILDYVKNHEDAWPFADPVDEEYAPNYYTVIRKPMDLQRMEDRLDAGYYKTFEKFKGDFQLIVDNCRLYNGAENEYTEMVDNLSKVFKRATEKFLDQISSSDDEIAVEFPKTEANSKEPKKSSKSEVVAKSSKRKHSLPSKTEKKREHSLSEESHDQRSPSYDSLDDNETVNKREKIAKKSNKPSKKEKNVSKKPIKDKKNAKASSKEKRDRHQSPARSRSPSRSVSRNSFPRSYDSSPPPSSVPSSPDNRFDFFPKKRLNHQADKETESFPFSKGKQKAEKMNERNNKSEDSHAKKQTDKPATSPAKPKDKHNKLRETIEKLKAKSEISKLPQDDFLFDIDTPKENRDKCNKEKEKNRTKDKLNKNHSKKNPDFEDSNSTLESIHAEKKSKKNSKSLSTKNSSIDALTIATEQTLKDINKWLDDTPKFSEFSSASNSPSYPPIDEFDFAKTETDRKKTEKPHHKKDSSKDVKRRILGRDPKFHKRREVQRTIDRLQPGKSKGNLISSVQSTKQEEFALGPLSKNKDTKNSLIVKTDDNAPKLSLGTVLDSFGRHQFIDDNPNAAEVEDNKEKDKPLATPKDELTEEVKQLTENENKDSAFKEDMGMMSTATPNLSAWFKAFGAPKVQSQKKEKDAKEEKVEEKSKEEPKVPVPEPSPTIDGSLVTQGQPIPRQRKVSTGSSVSERSSFSQDMDSPRVGIDERLGAYPAPYPSPLHRSPSGASPVMVSPRPEMSPKAPYPPFNGQIRVGFYQDTVSNKSSPDKGCSPRDNPQSPYSQCSEHVYTPNTSQNIAYSYPNSPYYSHTSNYSNTNPGYNPEATNSYYDTSKSLTDQYQAKSNYDSPHNQLHSPSETFREEQKADKVNQNVMFPVKKRAYNETEIMQMEQRFDNEKSVQIENIQHESKQASPNEQMAPALNYSAPSKFNYPTESNYLNIPSRSLDRKMEMGKYSNMGYTGPENFASNMQYPNYPRQGNEQQPPQGQQSEVLLQFNNSNYRHPEVNPSTPNVQQNYTNSAVTNPQTSYKSNEVSIPRPTYNAHLDMEQPLSLRGNIANLSHIVDRYNNDEQRMLSGLHSSASQYYGDKGLSGPHMFNKPICTSTSSLPIFNQPNMTIPSYNQNIQTPTSSMYNRQMTELQSSVMTNEVKSSKATPEVAEKRTKKRKSAKNAQPPPSTESPTPITSQGFQSYAGLKSNSPMEPSAISLKTASVVPGSAFNFGPSPSALGITSGLYDKDSYPNFLDEFRASAVSAPNYYIAAAAHHRSTPDSAPDKQARVAAHQPAARQPPPSYPFIGGRQAAPPASYFMTPPPPPTAQAPPQLMDAYQHYLQAGVLNQGLLGPPGAYPPPGYHPALSMRQPYDSMTRPPWL